MQWWKSLQIYITNHKKWINFRHIHFQDFIQMTKCFTKKKLPVCWENMIKHVLYMEFKIALKYTNPSYILWQNTHIPHTVSFEKKNSEPNEKTWNDENGKWNKEKKNKNNVEKPSIIYYTGAYMLWYTVMVGFYHCLLLVVSYSWVASSA